MSLITTAWAPPGLPVTDSSVDGRGGITCTRPGNRELIAFVTVAGSHCVHENPSPDASTTLTLLIVVTSDDFAVSGRPMAWVVATERTSPMEIDPTPRS